MKNNFLEDGFQNDGTAQTGRSLTEMLGMLAIMGILSVAGIAMYNSAMNKHYANTLINEGQKRAVVVAGQINMLGREPSLAEFNGYNTVSGGEFSDVTQTGLNGQFGIHVSNVEQAVCENVLASIGDATALRRLSPVDKPGTELTKCAANGAFLMIYNNNLQGASGDAVYCTRDEDCTGCDVCDTAKKICQPSPTGFALGNECYESIYCNSLQCKVKDADGKQWRCGSYCINNDYTKCEAGACVDTGQCQQGKLHYIPEVEYFGCDTTTEGVQCYQSDGAWSCLKDGVYCASGCDINAETCYNKYTKDSTNLCRENGCPEGTTLTIRGNKMGCLNAEGMLCVKECHGYAGGSWRCYDESMRACGERCTAEGVCAAGACLSSQCPAGTNMTYRSVSGYNFYVCQNPSTGIECQNAWEGIRCFSGGRACGLGCTDLFAGGSKCSACHVPWGEHCPAGTTFDASTQRCVNQTTGCSCGLSGYYGIRCYKPDGTEFGSNCTDYLGNCPKGFCS